MVGANKEDLFTRLYVTWNVDHTANDELVNQKSQCI